MREKDNNENIVLITYEVTGVNDLFVRLGNVNGKKTLKQVHLTTVTGTLCRVLQN